MDLLLIFNGTIRGSPLESSLRAVWLLTLLVSATLNKQTPAACTTQKAAVKS